MPENHITSWPLIGIAITTVIAFQGWVVRRLIYFGIGHAECEKDRENLNKYIKAVSDDVKYIRKRIDKHFDG